MDAKELSKRIAKCRICADRFAATKTAHQPRPVIQIDSAARIVIAGQAPGLRVHETGLPFNDRSGDRLREWMGIGRTEFYDPSKFAIVPNAFCFPGYDDNGSDLPPPTICAKTWDAEVQAALPNIHLRILVGGYAQKHFLKAKLGVTETVADWRRLAPDIVPLPHPSWRNTGWLRKHSWFEAETLPYLRQRIAEILP